MKLRGIALGLAVAALWSCEGGRWHSAGTGPNPIKIDEHSVLIPGTVISENDREAVSDIFKKYDRSLYRVGVYEKGTLKKLLGTMSEMQIGAIASEYASNAKASGLTNWAMKIGSTTHVTTGGYTTHVTTAGNPTHVTTSGNPTHVTTAGRPTHVTTVSHDSDALVKEVTPILEKYSK